MDWKWEGETGSCELPFKIKTARFVVEGQFPLLELQEKQTKENFCMVRSDASGLRSPETSKEFQRPYYIYHVSFSETLPSSS